MECDEISVGAAILAPALEVAESLDSIVSECRESQCMEDAEIILRRRAGNVDPRMLGILAYAIRCERKNKLDLHRQWTNLWARELRRVKAAQVGFQRIIDGDVDPRELALDALEVLDG